MSARAYAACRPAYRAQAIAYRRLRTLQLGPAMRLQFEDAATIRYQVQEVLHAEGIADPEAARCELDAYAHLLPDGSQWKASLLIELPEAAERARAMPLLSAAAHCLYVQARGRARVLAQANEDQPDRHRARPSGVHFLRFQLPRATCVGVLAGAAVAIGCTHPAYAWHAPLPAALLDSLRNDLAPRALSQVVGVPNSTSGWPARSGCSSTRAGNR